MREDKFSKDESGYRLSENRRWLTEGSPESLKTKRGTWAGKSVVSCLVGSLLLMLAMVIAPSVSSAQTGIGIWVSFGPPAIPVYVQPACPAPGYIWTPGYWAWDPVYGYYWVPGTWVLAPFVGALWTPGYWGWYNSGYRWYPGYWGTVVGFYGGINYGFGYTGRGYFGGYWRGGRFYYNRAVNRITSRTITTVYRQRVVVNERGPLISYNGGPGGIVARATPEQVAAERTRHFGAVNQQLEHRRLARTNPAQRARENRGRPEVAATPRPREFRGNGVVRATRAGEPYREPPREVRRSAEPSRQAPAQVERRPQSNAPRQAQPNRQMERPAPQQQRNERQVNRNNERNTVQRNSPQSRPEPQARRSEGRAAPEQRAHPQNKGRHEGGDNRNPGRGRR